MSTPLFRAFLVFAFARGAHGHGAVTKPYPRKLPSLAYCPWCVGEHHPEANPPGQINHDVIPSSPCLGTARGDEKYTRQNFGSKYGSVAGPGQQVYVAGETFETTIVLDADHNGDAVWSLCPHSEGETETCFRQRPLTNWTDVHTHWDATVTDDHWKSGQHFPQNVALPPDTPGGPATLRWFWVCKYTDEVFVSCIDVQITSGGPPLLGSTAMPATTPGAPTTAAAGPCAEEWGQCGGTGWSGPSCCMAGIACVIVNQWYHQCLSGVPLPTPSPTYPLPTPSPSPRSSTSSRPVQGGACSCGKATAWSGGFGQFVGDGSFCNQDFGGESPWISAGGGSASSGGWSGTGPCASGQYSFTGTDGWQISVAKNQGQGQSPYRAFAYAQLCNGRPYGECWAGLETVTFSFSFKTQGVEDVAAYVKLLFWTDGGNILGLLPPMHPNGQGKLRLVAFPTNDYPNSWSDDVPIQDGSWYHLQIDFTPSSRSVRVRLDGVVLSHGSVPVDMVAATHGPQLGVYSFDYGSQPWSEGGFKLWLDDACVGQTSGNCPSGPTHPTGPIPTVSTSSSTVTVEPAPEPTTSAEPGVGPTPEPEPEPEPCLEFDARMKDCLLQGSAFQCESCPGDAEEPCCSCRSGQGTTSPTPRTATETTATSLAPSGKCKAWCDTNQKDWMKKCTWAACSGCPSCHARRLRAGSHILV